MKLNFLLLLFFIYSNLFTQNKPSSTIKLDCPKVLRATDIDSAIYVGTSSKILIYCSPVGSGKKQEVASGSKSNPNYFEKEHHVIWLKLKIAQSGNLSFLIKPQSNQDDYDFLLFKHEGEQSLNNIKNKKQKPIRSNLSRNNIEAKGYTGLSLMGKSTHVPSGPNNEFSQGLKVEKDEEYYLVLDNVYEEGKGAVIELGYYETKLITGYVSDQTKENKIEAEVTFEDASTGEILQQTTSNPKTGYFEMEVPFVITNPDKMYLLTIGAEEYFFEEHTLTTKQILEKDAVPLEIILPKLKKGLRAKVNNINFVGGKAQIVPSSKPSLKRLLKLMEKNNKLEIVIEGHTNGCPDGVGESQQLSEHRALQVKKYLIDNNISENRIATIGYNCEKMLFKNPINEQQQHLNRRVEIVVTEF
jgi:outer membrane protein OmpA-like peptidoglycan-associated protein